MFHFRLSLVSNDEDQIHQRAIRFDINPSAIDLNHPMRGLLVVEYKEYASSKSPGTDLFIVYFCPGLLASGICEEHFVNQKLDQYE